MDKDIVKIKEAVLILADYLLDKNTAEEVRTIKEILNPKFCNISTCNSPEPHFHCSECASKNGHHAEQCKYKIATTRTY